MVDVVVPMYINQDLLEKVRIFVCALRNFNQRAASDESQTSSTCRTSIVLSSEQMLTNISRMLFKYGKWDNIQNWDERIICEYVQNNENCASSFNQIKKTHKKYVDRLKTIIIHTDIPKVSKIVMDANLERSADTCPSQCILPQKSFVEYFRSFTKEHWRISVVKSWSAKTIKQAFASMNDTQPEMRVDIEFISQKMYFKKHTDGYIATSLLMKIACIFLEQCRLF